MRPDTDYNTTGVQACNKPQKVEREAYDGPAMDIDMSAMNLSAARDADANGKTPERAGEDFHHRPPTRSGGRNMQESSFAFSGRQLTVQVTAALIIVCCNKCVCVRMNVCMLGLLDD